MSIKFLLNYLIFSLAIFISLLISNLISKIYISIDIQKEQEFHKTYNEFKIYEKYFDFLHHLKVNSFNNQPLIFEPLNESWQNQIDEKKSNIILFQGDSWAEGLSNKESKIVLNDYLNKNNFVGYNSGVSSYSFSPMTVQLKILKEDFNLDPKIIVAIIDYTDFGDEICRYKDKLILKNNKLLGIHPENILSGDFPNQTLFINKYKIFYSNEYYSLSKIIRYAYIKLKRKIFLKNTLCSWDIISSFLKENLSIESKNILKEAYKRYLAEVFSSSNIEKLIIVSHPHKQHIYNEYINYWQEIINSTSIDKNLSKKIIFIDFKDKVPEIYTKNGIKENNIFIKDDLSSHLTKESHKVFTKEIVNSLIRSQFN